MIVVLSVNVAVPLNLNIGLPVPRFLYLNGCNFLFLPLTRINRQRKSFALFAAILRHLDIINLFVLVEVEIVDPFIGIVHQPLEMLRVLRLLHEGSHRLQIEAVSRRYGSLHVDIVTIIL